MSNLTICNPSMEQMRRGGFYCITIVLFGLMGCAKEQRPAGVLSREQYAALLVDVYLAEGKLSNMAITQDSALKLYLPYEAFLFKTKGLSDSVVRETYQYYLDHPDEMEAVYNSVIDTLNLREQRAIPSNPSPQ